MIMSAIAPRAVVLLLTVTLWAGESLAQDEPTEMEQELFLHARDTLSVPTIAVAPEDSLRWYSMFSNLPDDWVRLGTTTFSVESIPSITGIGVLTGTLVLTDHMTYRATRKWIYRSAGRQAVMGKMVYGGDGRVHLGLAGGFALYGLLAADHSALVVGSQTVESLLASGIVVQLLKGVTGRESPGACTNPPGKWRMFPNLKSYIQHQPRYYAFPSGHMTTLTATITVMAENYPEAVWLRPAGYTVIGLVGIGLVGKGYHWYSDLPLGIALGRTVGNLIAQRGGTGEGSGTRGDPAHVRMSPTVTPYGPGLALSVPF